MKIFFKILISIWASYHLFCIWVLPNAGGFVGRYFADEIVPYGNAISMNTPWNLFSPDPANTMYFASIVHYDEAHTSSDMEQFFPPEKSQIVTDSSERRLLYAMRYLVLDPRRIEVILGPWLCRLHPGALEVSIRYIMEKIPSYDLVLISPDKSVQQLKVTEESSSQFFTCNGAGS